jgi:hypothetical protein
MDRDEMGDIIKRMMRDMAEDDASGDRPPRCDGCGKREPLEPYLLRASNGSVEPVMYCIECRALASIVEADGRDS